MVTTTNYSKSKWKNKFEFMPPILIGNAIEILFIEIYLVISVDRIIDIGFKFVLYLCFSQIKTNINCDRNCGELDFVFLE